MHTILVYTCLAHCALERDMSTQSALEYIVSSTVHFDMMLYDCTLSPLFLREIKVQRNLKVSLSCPLSDITIKVCTV